MTAAPSTSRPNRSRRRGEAVAGSVALIAHAGVLAMIFLLPPHPSVTPEERPVEVTVLSAETPTTDVPPPGAVAAETPRPRDPTRPLDRTVDLRHLATAQEPTRQGENAAPLPYPEPALSSEAPWIPSWSLPSGIDLGLDGGIAWRAPVHPDHVSGEGQEDPSPRDPGRLRDALDEGDRARGLGSGGPVVSAVHEAARAINAMHDGAATIDVTTDAAGRVLSVRVAEVASDQAAWAEAARAIAEALQGRTLTVPHGARGVVVSVRVDVAVRLPSGAAVGHSVAPVASADGVNPGVGVGFDLSDIGARPRSVVHARVVAERRL